MSQLPFRFEDFAVFDFENTCPDYVEQFSWYSANLVPVDCISPSKIKYSIDQYEDWTKVQVSVPYWTATHREVESMSWSYTVNKFFAKIQGKSKNRILACKWGYFGHRLAISFPRELLEEPEKLVVQTKRQHWSKKENWILGFNQIDGIQDTSCLVTDFVFLEVARGAAMDDLEIELKVTSTCCHSIDYEIMFSALNLIELEKTKLSTVFAIPWTYPFLHPTKCEVGEYVKTVLAWLQKECQDAKRPAFPGTLLFCPQANDGSHPSTIMFSIRINHGQCRAYSFTAAMDEDGYALELFADNFTEMTVDRSSDERFFNYFCNTNEGQAHSAGMW
jgi:hypothetical protein